MNENWLLTNKNNNIAISILRPRHAWVALLPIAWLQLTLAVHQFNHVADYVDDSCHVCVQLDRMDASADQAAREAPLQLISAVLPAAPSDTVRRFLVRNFDSRAPPGL
jgi:hypothetical protein